VPANLRTCLCDILAVCFLLLIMVCPGHSSESQLISGSVMGTTYHIRYLASDKVASGKLHESIQGILESVSQSMSIHIQNSEINRFNHVRDTHTKFWVSDQFLSVLKEAASLYRLTDGSWDGTVYPLVELWGFGVEEKEFEVPRSSLLKQVLTYIGFDKIEFDSSGYLRKKNPDVTLDLNSIAKGYGVDQVAFFLKKKNINDFIVEVGGEIYASGEKAEGRLWKVGINRPDKGSSAGDVYRVVPLKNKAMATSGDYRNFYVKDDVLYSHIIDPRTGMSVQNGVVSATVISDACTFADGLATALMVMGEKKGIELVDTIDDTECLIVVRNPDQSFKDYYSKGFHSAR